MTVSDTEALLLRVVPHGESDLVVTLVTRVHGKLSAFVRGGRRSWKRVGGALEPLHTLEVRVDDRGGELASILSAKLFRIRLSLVRDLDGMQAAGVALRMARAFFPPRSPEPAGWAVLEELLDALDTRLTEPRVLLSRASLLLLRVAGYGIEFERCVGCGKACPEGRKASVDVLRGGVVCRECGGGGTLLSSAARMGALRCLSGDCAGLSPSDADSLVQLAFSVLRHQTGGDP